MEARHQVIYGVTAVLGSLHDTHYPQDSRKVVVNMKKVVSIDKSTFSTGAQRYMVCMALMNCVYRKLQLVKDR